MKFGAQLWSQSSDWPTFRDGAVRVERAGWDSLWTWDHLLAVQGSWQQPIFEGWLSLAAWATLTSRVRVGLMVGANTFRNPGLTAKLATTLDHISGGRAVLGIGGAWFEREHDAFGIGFGSGLGERLDRLDEAVMLIRRLLDGETIDHEGRYYTMHDALQAPRPIQRHLPILIGGSGPRKTLRTVARYGDSWNTAGLLEDVTARVAILREHCAAVNRDPSTIEMTISFPITIRDRLPDAERARAELLAYSGVHEGPGARDQVPYRLGSREQIPYLLGSPDTVADQIRPYRNLGFETVIVRLPAPYDAETIERIVEVRDLLER
jgi:F420-dependent oxidoreductase-like protein